MADPYGLIVEYLHADHRGMWDRVNQAPRPETADLHSRITTLAAKKGINRALWPQNKSQFLRAMEPWLEHMRREIPVWERI